MSVILPFQRQELPSFASDSSVCLESVEGIPLFRASTDLQERIEYLLNKQRDEPLLATEESELDAYEELDDYVSLVNRLVRNLYSGNSNEYSDARNHR